ncbi:MAG: glycosyltransferase [Anaerolinea sp.]|nr:glycosyltransferase [Anaerolinea sp.]
MRVTHIIKATRIAGAERHLLTLLPALVQRGADVSLILIHEPDKPVADFADALTAGGVTVVRVPIPRHIDFTLFGRLRRALRQLKPDIAHTHLLHADLYGVIAARLAGVRKVVISRHNDDQFRTLLPFRLIHNLLWGMSSGGIAISEAIRQFCIRVEGVRPTKIQTIHYGLTLPIQQADRQRARAALSTELKLPADALILGVVCRLIAQKGIAYALRALPRIDNAVLVIAGEGSLRAALEAEARALGIAERVHFLGWREDTAALMAAFDIFLAPSLWEGFGLVLLEAMAQQTPIIASSVSAIPEIVVDRETGRLVPPRDPVALAAAIHDLQADPALRRHMGLIGQDRLETVFNADHMTAQTYTLYSRLMGRKDN